MKKELSLSERVGSPTPHFFRKVRRIGIILGAAGTALLTAPVALPAAVTAVAGYLVTAGLIASAVSTAAVEREGE